MNIFNSPNIGGKIQASKRTRIVNCGYYFIAIYCVVAIMYSIIMIRFYATIVVNRDEYIKQTIN